MAKFSPRHKALRTEIEKEATQLEFNATHLIAEDDKADALKMVDAARAMMRESAARLRAAMTGKFPS